MEPIKKVDAELFTPIENNAIIRLPGRRFPGILIQGDSFSILVNEVREVWTRALDGKDESLQEAITSLRESLEAIQKRYESVLARHGIELPYVRQT